MVDTLATWAEDSWEVLDSDQGFFWKIEIHPFELANV